MSLETPSYTWQAKDAHSKLKEYSDALAELGYMITYVGYDNNRHPITHPSAIPIAYPNSGTIRIDTADKREFFLSRISWAGENHQFSCAFTGLSGIYCSQNVNVEAMVLLFKILQLGDCLLQLVTVDDDFVASKDYPSTNWLLINKALAAAGFTVLKRNRSKHGSHHALMWIWMDETRE